MRRAMNVRILKLKNGINGNEIISMNSYTHVCSRRWMDSYVLQSYIKTVITGQYVLLRSKLRLCALTTFLDVSLVLSSGTSGGSCTTADDIRSASSSTVGMVDTDRVASTVIHQRLESAE